jgi:hypothetical protein
VYAVRQGKPQWCSKCSQCSAGGGAHRSDQLHSSQPWSKWDRPAWMNACTGALHSIGPASPSLAMAYVARHDAMRCTLACCTLACAHSGATPLRSMHAGYPTYTSARVCCACLHALERREARAEHANGAQQPHKARDAQLRLVITQWRRCSGCGSGSHAAARWWRRLRAVGEAVEETAHARVGETAQPRAAWMVEAIRKTLRRCGRALLTGGPRRSLSRQASRDYI